MVQRNTGHLAHQKLDNSTLRPLSRDEQQVWKQYHEMSLKWKNSLQYLILIFQPIVIKVKKSYPNELLAQVQIFLKIISYPCNWEDNARNPTAFWSSSLFNTVCHVFSVHFKNSSTFPSIAISIKQSHQYFFRHFILQSDPGNWSHSHHTWLPFHFVPLWSLNILPVTSSWIDTSDDVTICR